MVEVSWMERCHRICLCWWSLHVRNHIDCIEIENGYKYSNVLPFATLCKWNNEKRNILMIWLEAEHVRRVMTDDKWFGDTDTVRWQAAIHNTLFQFSQSNPTAQRWVCTLHNSLHVGFNSLLRWCLHYGQMRTEHEKMPLRVKGYLSFFALLTSARAGNQICDTWTNKHDVKCSENTVWLWPSL